MIRFGTLDYTDKERNALSDLINQKDPQLSMGKNVHLFEMTFARWLGSKYAVLMNSGTSALMAALQSVKDYYEGAYTPIKRVATTALTYPANWNTIKYCGLKPYIEDVTDQYVVDYGKSKVLCDEDTALMAVNLLGKPCHGIDRLPPEIEDSCEALGSSLNGKKLGTFGDCGVFSFYVSHQISTIEGGMVVTDNPVMYENLLSARDNGRLCVCPVCTLKFEGRCNKRFATEVSHEKRWETGTVLGGNFKPTEIQGALGCVKMESIDENINARNKIFLKYSEEFNTLKQEKGEFIVPIAYPVEVKNPQKACERLERVGIEARGMFPSYAMKYKNATKLSSTNILIPLHHKLSDEDVEFVIEQVKLCQNL